MKEVLKVLASRISRKAIILTVGMILIYMAIVTPGVVALKLAVGSIGGLATLGAVMQFYIDIKKLDKDK